MLNSLFVLTLVATPVELTVVQSVPLRMDAHPAKIATRKGTLYAEKSPKRTVSTAFVDAQGKLHVQCEQREHAHDSESEQ